jgi:hypothetical protein
MEYHNHSVQIIYPDELIRQDYDDPSIDDRRQEALRATFTSKDGKVHAKISTQIFGVMNVPDSAATVASNYTATYPSQLKDYNQLSGGQINLKPIDETIPPPDAYAVEFTYTDPKLGPLQEREIFVVNRAPYVFVDLEFFTSPDNYPAYKDTFDKMLYSFQIYPSADDPV